ncbi:MAG: hypothetical protein N2321_01730 [Melioribacteraceae bacterium]|mgnify:CR=1 FL=1|nr:hypothetical protein [Melioribacteraceae bacterium]
MKKLFFLFCISLTVIYGQSNQLIKENSPNVYIDCSYCDLNFIKEKIPIVNFVRDRKDADIHILFTRQSTASGGSEFIIYFIGQNNFSNINDTVKYQINNTDSDDISRNKMVNNLKIGLINYLKRSFLSEYLTINFNLPQKQEEQKVDDWNFWYFTTSANSSFNGEKNYKYIYLNTSLSASRITEDLKLSFRLSSNYNENQFNYFDGVSDKKILSVRRSQYFTSFLVKSIDQNWSWGSWLGANSSTFENIEFNFYISPGIEYNIFPYSQSNEKQLRIDYRIRHSFTNYSEETIYFKKKENLWSHSLEVNFTLIKPWGNIHISTEAGNYLHNFNLYELEIDGSLSLKLLKGLSLNLFGGYSKINNQLSLRRSGASLEEVLTQRRQLETSFSYWGGFGISYSFGSIYNNIVNPRFGNNSGGGMTIMFSN